VFPSNGSLLKHPLPSPGSHAVRFPWLDGTMRCCDFPSPLTPRSLPPRDVTPVPFAVRSCTAERRCAGRELLSRAPRTGTHLGRRQDLSGSWGTFVPMPCSWAPAGPTHAPGLYGAPAWPLLQAKAKAPHEQSISGLNPGAWTLAVYASPEQLPTQDARLASGCLARPGRVGLVTHKVPAKGFRVASLHHFLLSQAS
jgi:hypothetical protein